jgi:hypothetical protein
MLLPPRRWVGRSNVLDLFEYPVEAYDQTHAVHDQPNEDEEDQRELVSADSRPNIADVRDCWRWGKFIVPIVSEL